MNRTIGIVLFILGVIGLALSNFVFNRLGWPGTGHNKADVSFLLGAILIGLGVYAMTRKSS